MLVLVLNQVLGIKSLKLNFRNQYKDVWHNYSGYDSYVLEEFHYSLNSLFPNYSIFVVAT